MGTSRTCQRLQRDGTKKKIKDIGVEKVEKGDPFLISSEWADDVSKCKNKKYKQ